MRIITALVAFGVIVGLGVLAVLVSVVGALVTRRRQKRRPAARTEAIVEVRCGTLVAFDFPSEGVAYEIPQFAPGRYRVPLDAVRRAAAKDRPSRPDATISVDTATLFLVDAGFEDKLRAIEDRLFEEINASPAVVHRYGAVVRELGIKFDYLDVGADGAYVLDVSRIERVSE
jgi:hypothetical protein